MNRLDLEKSYVLTRRDLLKAGLILGGGTFALGGIVVSELGKATPRPEVKPSQPSPSPTLVTETTAPALGVPPFVDAEANEIARKKGIGPDSFFIFQSKTLDNLSAFLGDSLYPIYPLTVLKHKELIYDLSKEFSIPPNIIATIMTIESGGLKNEVSWVGAQGLFQVMPFHFDQKIQDDQAAMQDPYLNGRTGMKFFKEVCLKAARDGFPRGYPQNHVTVYARALMAYNAGANAGRISFDRLPDETKFYGDHFIRFALSAEIADGLRKKENGDLDIVRKMASTDMTAKPSDIDARAYALDRFVQRRQGLFAYDEYVDVLKELSRETPGFDKEKNAFSEKGEPFYRDYKDYLNSPGYRVPVSPGLRIWINLGGRALFLKDPLNSNLEEWNKVQSR